MFDNFSACRLFPQIYPKFLTKSSAANFSFITKNVPWSSGHEQDKAHAYVTSILTNDSVLAIFDPELPIKLHTDPKAVWVMERSYYKFMMGE